MTFSLVARCDDGARLGGRRWPRSSWRSGSAVPAAVAGVGRHRHTGRRQRRLQGRRAGPTRRGSPPRWRRLQRCSRTTDQARRPAGRRSSTPTAVPRPTPATACLDWAGRRHRRRATRIQGNILAGAGVVLAPCRGVGDQRLTLPFARRLLDGAGRRRRRRRRPPRADSPRRSWWSAKAPATAVGDDVAVDLRVDDHPDSRSPSSARLLDLSDLYLAASTPEERGGRRAPESWRRSSRRFGSGRTGAARTSQAWVGSRELRDAGRARALVRSGSTSRVLRDRAWHHRRPGAGTNHEGGAQGMSVLAIDAGRRCHGGGRDPRGDDRSEGLPGVRPALPTPGLGRARARGDLAGDPGGHPRGPRQATPSEVTAIGITNQRETVLVWDRETLGSPRRAIVWQDRRTADVCARLRDAGHEDRVAELTGLRARPVLLGHQAGLAARGRAAHRALVEAGRSRSGTVDSYLIARMTRRHVARHRRLERVAHPALRPRERRAGPTSCAGCSASRGTRCPRSSAAGARSAPPTRPPFLGLELPIAGIAGDQQAALFGQTCFDGGRLEVHLRHRLVHPHQHRRRRSSAPTPGCSRPRPGAVAEGELTYALEGAIFVTGAAVQWLRDGLQIVGSAAETSRRSPPRSRTPAGWCSCRP